ncbi:hypothetical protein MLD38_034010 [Melastoma candidum]|uniref:Uncharacterized protein n=1 Tax=Melastoma candidum TaxID=119954 RepID=A0ACB9M959_9MYRT|nr:hypothetical protein MLD38_034010 [Melastoma candidum]
MVVGFRSCAKARPIYAVSVEALAEQGLERGLAASGRTARRMFNRCECLELASVLYKLGVRYRLWRDAVERGAKQLPFGKSD